MYSFTEIVKRIKGRFTNETSRIEGTFSMDNAQAVAQELAMIHATEIAPIKDAVFLDTATGTDLDRRAADFDETRHPPTAATGQLLFCGTPKTFVPPGTVARYDALRYETTEAARIDASGEALAPAVCQTTGSGGNLPAGLVKSLVKMVPGVRETSNPVAFEGGTDAEGDTAFRARVYEKIRRPITSGNEYYYEHLAKQVPGIWRARCHGCWNGPGTVKIVLLAAGSTPPDNALVAKVRQHVEAQRVIGADITYMAAQPLPVAITGKLVLADGYIIEDVAPAIGAEFAAYFSEIAFDGVTKFLSYHKAIEMVFRAAGVQDIATLNLNGAAASVAIGADAFCVLQGVNLNGN